MNDWHSAAALGHGQEGRVSGAGGRSSECADGAGQCLISLMALVQSMAEKGVSAVLEEEVQNVLAVLARRSSSMWYW